MKSVGRRLPPNKIVAKIRYSHYFWSYSLRKKIFLSYRRDDSAGQTGRLRDILVEELGDDCVFLDVDNIPLGTNFVEKLTQEVSSCAFLLVVIGSQWLSLRDASGKRRVDNPSDAVRIEVVTALQGNISVVPILLDGTEMPPADSLPEDMKALVVHHGIEINHTTFRPDVDRLVRGLKPSFGDARRLSTFEVLLFSFCAWLFSGLLAIAIVVASIGVVASLPNSSPSAVRWFLGIVAITITLIIAFAGPPIMAMRLKRARNWSWPKAWTAIGSSAGLFGMFGGIEASYPGYLAVNAATSFCWLVVFTLIRRK
jgi:hypothetical protein